MQASDVKVGYTLLTKGGNLVQLVAVNGDRYNFHRIGWIAGTEERFCRPEPWAVCHESQIPCLTERVFSRNPAYAGMSYDQAQIPIAAMEE